MASSHLINSSNQKKPFMMLKDYLRDDLSSCSSNGFKSFPRRQCCTTVRLFLDIDLKKTNNSTKPLKRSRSKKAASTTISVLQKASDAVINAVKLLPFPSSVVKFPSPSPSSSLTSSVQNRFLLPRSFARRLFKKRSLFRRKTRDDNEIGRWRSFRELLQEQDKPSDQHATDGTVISSWVSTSSSNSNCNSDSWTESEFTANRGNSEILILGIGNDAAEVKKDGAWSEKHAVTVGEEDSITNHSKEWPNEEEKEQCSPVCVLDCPFKDEEEGICSPFQCSLVHMEEIKQKLTQKIRRFESLAELEPVDLEKRIALAELDNKSLQSSTRPCSMSIHKNNNNMLDEIKEEHGTEKDARELLKLAKATAPTNFLISKAESLLLDFFNEKIVEYNANVSRVKGHKEFEQELVVAQDWINGHPQEIFFGWEGKDCRHVYIIDMEKNGKWRNLDEEKEELALELEVEVFGSLVNEAFLDISSN